MDKVVTAALDPLLRDGEGWLNISVKVARKMRLLLTAANLLASGHDRSYTDAVDSALELENILEDRLAAGR